ncbi:MAG: cytochrome b5-like heme/steroid binding domain-containing protein [Candidatus Diapherotrites archaeon]|nr:cytochrome b5-like heme/steroid binding domain-containing protein [Candidatus Diapherotrites archaeon]
MGQKLIFILLLSAALLLSGCAITLNPKDIELSQTPVNSGSAGSINSGISQDQNPQIFQVTLTLAEVAKHNKAGDCWMAINGKVLDLSGFTNHPSGLTYAPYCGTDATQAYGNKGGGGPPHSSTADAMMQSFFIGNLGDKISVSVLGNSTVSSVSSNSSNNQPSSSQSGRERDFERDDD